MVTANDLMQATRVLRVLLQMKCRASSYYDVYIWVILMAFMFLHVTITIAALNCTAKPKSPAVSGGRDPLDMPRTPHRASEGKRSQ